MKVLRVLQAYQILYGLLGCKVRAKGFPRLWTGLKQGVVGVSVGSTTVQQNSRRSFCIGLLIVCLGCGSFRK